MPVLFPGGGASLAVDLSQVAAEVAPALGASGVSDLVFWSEDDVYDYANEAVKRLAASTGMFTALDGSSSITAGQATYSVPARHHLTLDLALGNASLRKMSMQSLQFLDDEWSTRDGSPNWYIEDEAGVSQVRLYPIPDASASGALNWIYSEFPPDVTPAAPVLSGVPAVLSDFLYFSLIATAREAESKGMMPESAALAKGVASLLETAFDLYWGAVRYA